MDRNFSEQDIENQWANLTATLNSCVSPHKTIAGWKKSWQDLKKSAKEKVASLEKHKKTIDGGAALGEELISLQERILSLLGDSCVLGCQYMIVSAVTLLERIQEQQQSTVVEPSTSVDNVQ